MPPSASPPVPSASSVAPVLSPSAKPPSPVRAAQESAGGAKDGKKRSKGPPIKAPSHAKGGKKRADDDDDEDYKTDDCTDNSDTDSGGGSSESDGPPAKAAAAADGDEEEAEGIRRRSKLSLAAVDALRNWFLEHEDHPYASPAMSNFRISFMDRYTSDHERNLLKKPTGLTGRQITNWVCASHKLVF